MRIAYVTSTFPCWSETFVLDEIVDHSENGIDLTIFSLKKCRETTIHAAAAPFIENTTYAYTVFDPRLWSLHLLLALSRTSIYFSTLFAVLYMPSQARIVWLKSLMVFFLSPRFIFLSRSKNIEHLHAHFATYPALLSWIVGRFTKTPFSITAHAHDLYVNQDILSLIWKDAAYLVTISEYNRRFIITLFGAEAGRKTRVIHCGIDVDRFPLLRSAQTGVRTPGPVRIISVGRLTEIKGFPCLLDALALLSGDRIDFKSEIVGDGPMRGELERRIQQLDLGDDVRMLGARTSEEMPQVLGKADLFVLACSKGRVEGQDGIPVVIMEAMALGVPVISTRISGVPELVRDGETGLCVEPGNPASLRDAIVYLVQHPDEAFRMSQAARKLIEAEFSVKKSCAELRKFLAITKD